MIAKRMEFGFSGKVRSVSDLGTIEKSKVETLSIELDLGNPLHALLVPTYPKESAFAVFVRAFPIMNIFGSGCFPKIGNGVVRSDAINMVNLSGRKGIMHVQPCQSVSEVSPAVNQDTDVSIFSEISSDGSGVFSATRNGAGKQPSLRTIVQNFAQSFNRNVCRIFNSHDAPPVRWDQGPGRVDSACLASPY